MFTRYDVQLRNGGGGEGALPPTVKLVNMTREFYKEELEEVEGSAQLNSVSLCGVICTVVGSFIIIIAGNK